MIVYVAVDMLENVIIGITTSRDGAADLARVYWDYGPDPDFLVENELFIEEHTLKETT